MASSRARLAALITPMLPAGWRHIETHTVQTIGRLSKPTVFIDFTTMSHDGMPAGQLVDGFEVALISHLTDYSKAEDELDAAARTLVRALDESPDIAWSTASKRAFGQTPTSTYLGWSVTVQLLTPKTEE